MRSPQKEHDFLLALSFEFLDDKAVKFQCQSFVKLLRACCKTYFQPDYSQPEIRYNQEAVNHCETAGVDVMAYNFKNCDWDQLFLFPPDIRDWLLQDHLVRFITEIVSRLDLSPFYSRYNPEGDGRPAYHPAMMTALYFYSYCSGERSSRRIERLCMESVPYRVVSGGLQPDHTTISRFRKKFASELSSLFLQIITLCRKAGLCILNTVSLDGTKIGANASLSANRNEAGLRKEIKNYFREAEEADAREDELYGPGRRGDELPPDLSTQEGRLRKLREIQKSLREEKEEKVRKQDNEDCERAPAGIQRPGGGIGRPDHPERGSDSGLQRQKAASPHAEKNQRKPRRGGRDPADGDPPGGCGLFQPEEPGVGRFRRPGTSSGGKQ